MTIDKKYLLTDAEVAKFIVTGYHMVQLDLPSGINQSIAHQLDALDYNPGDAITDVVPELNLVLDHPATKGVLISLLGKDYKVQAHRHWHCKLPNSGHMQWHQDSVNRRDTSINRFLGLYYPTDITPDMGPTVIVPGTHFEFLNDEAVALEDDQPALLHLRSGRVLRAKQAVLALGNFPPADPRIEDDSFFRSERYIAHAWSNNAVSRIGNTDPLIMIGSGLTMLDLAVELDARGHRAPIQCLSRHGLKPQRHRPYEPWPPFLKAGDATSARDLLHRVRVEAALAMSQGKDWRAVIDSLRVQTPGIWKSLPLYEKRRFLRHVRPFWEVHRHRVAPHVADVIDRRMGAGLLEIFGGRLRALRETPTGAEAVYMPRRESKLRSLQGAFVVNCTGPEGDFRKLRHPLVDSLLEHGLARPDRLGMGLDVAADGALMDAWGEASSWLFTLGPLRKGALWETTAVPEIRVQAAELARRLLSS
ncbi:MAG: phytanoyl-CoA dioxygenase family protein [Planctomycetaceae bacterium]|nr:phytanoyl-CoA dioxygenase family protein [Planctomycetaceae bacterium]